MLLIDTKMGDQDTMMKKVHVYMRLHFMGLDIYAPNFEEVGGAYCFWGIHALRFVMHSITLEPCRLGF